MWNAVRRVRPPNPQLSLQLSAASEAYRPGQATGRPLDRPIREGVCQALTREPGDLPALSLMHRSRGWPGHGQVSVRATNRAAGAATEPGLPGVASAGQAVVPAFARAGPAPAETAPCPRRPMARGNCYHEDHRFTAGVGRHRPCRGNARHGAKQPVAVRLRCGGQRDRRHGLALGRGHAGHRPARLGHPARRRGVAGTPDPDRVRRAARRARARGQPYRRGRRDDAGAHPRQREQPCAGADRRDRGVRPVPGRI